MAQIPNLENSPLDLSAIRDHSQKDLITILTSIRGKKCLVIEQKLGGSISLIVPTSLLKEYGTEIHHLSRDPIHTDCGKIVFLVPSQLSYMKIVSSYIKTEVSKGYQREYFLFFVPRRTVVCEKILEEEKVHHLLTIGEYPLYVVPLDEDVLSFELDLSAKECLVDGDMGSLWVIAKAIHKLEAIFGVIPSVSSKGKASVRVAELLSHLQEEEPVNISDMTYPEISTLILLDREVDMVTPMLVQLTYEGLLDEFLSVNTGSVEFDASIMGGVQQEGKKVKVPLNSNDKLFKEIRDLNFEVVVQVLRQKAMSMKKDYTDISTMTQTVSELKDFVKKLNSLPEMTRHINLAQHLTKYSSKPSFLGRIDMEHTIVDAHSYDICFDYIEEMIHKQEPLISVLRLLVLFSVTNSGLPKKHFYYLKRELLHSYGFEHVVTLRNLEKAGLLKKQVSRSEWSTIKNELHLVVEDSDTMKPTDISYVFSGYAPLTIRLVQHAVRSGWRPIEEVLKLLPGPHSEMKRGGYQMNTSSSRIVEGRRRVVLIVFIGGVTFAEISALRFLAAQEGMGYDLVVATTKIINGNTLLHSFMDTLG